MQQELQVGTQETRPSY